MSLNQKTAIVTGAGSGIGRAVALMLAQRGANVAIIDINEADAVQTASSITAAGGKARSFRADVGRTGELDAAMNAAIGFRIVRAHSAASSSMAPPISPTSATAVVFGS